MPYGYYQLVRFLCLIGFSILAYRAFQLNNLKEMVIFVCLAILFQPLLKISLGRTLWNLVDLVVGLFLVFSAFSAGSKTNDES